MDNYNWAFWQNKHRNPNLWGLHRLTCKNTEIHCRKQFADRISTAVKHTPRSVQPMHQIYSCTLFCHLVQELYSNYCAQQCTRKTNTRQRQRQEITNISLTPKSVRPMHQIYSCTLVLELYSKNSVQNIKTYLIQIDLYLKHLCLKTFVNIFV